MAADEGPSTSETAATATTPPAQPEEGDLTELGDASGEAPAPTETNGTGPVAFASACEPGYRYVPTSKGKDYHKGVGIEQANDNGTTGAMESTFTSEVTGEVGISFTGELRAKATVAVAEIEAKYAVNLSLKATAKMGNQVKVKTRPKKTTYARYGVYRMKSTGYSQYIYLILWNQGLSSSSPCGAGLRYGRKPVCLGGAGGMVEGAP